ncbi:HD family phosphohydrolase [Clostridia bacterium]|nr:HD family phosphohydrolase [Clostridia bacterium]
MRYVPANCITEGAILGKTLLGINGEVLLKVGSELKRPYISRILDLGVQGVYIDDDLSEGIEVRDIISAELRSASIRNVKSSFAQVEKPDGATSRSSVRVEETLKMVENIVDEILNNNATMVNIVDIKTYDDYTFYHCLNVTVMSVLIGLGLNFSREKLCKLAYGALLHDVGKVFLDKEMINRPGILTEEEFVLVRRHPTEGYLYLREHYHMSEISARAVLEHHERYDGSGYPKKRVGTDISEFGRILAVADVYDALVSDRPHRKGLFPTEAVEYVLGGAGRMFDPDIVNIFARRFSPFPEGTVVLLSNGLKAVVVQNMEGHSQRPQVKVFAQEMHRVEPYVLDLSMDREALDVTIVATLAM